MDLGLGLGLGLSLGVGCWVLGVGFECWVWDLNVAKFVQVDFRQADFVAVRITAWDGTCRHRHQRGLVSG